jgi:hypothetical protein
MRAVHAGPAPGVSHADHADEVQLVSQPAAALAPPITALPAHTARDAADMRTRPGKLNTPESAGAALAQAEQGELAVYLHALATGRTGAADRLILFLEKSKLTDAALAGVGRMVLAQMNDDRPQLAPLRAYFASRGVDLYPRDRGYRWVRDRLAEEASISTATARELTAGLRGLCHPKDLAGARWALLQSGLRFADAGDARRFFGLADQLSGGERDRRELARVVDEALAGRGDLLDYADDVRGNADTLHALRRMVEDRVCVAYSRASGAHARAVGEINRLRKDLEVAADKAPVLALLHAATARLAVLQGGIDLGPVPARAEALLGALDGRIGGRFDRWGTVLQARFVAASGGDVAAAAQVSAAALVSRNHGDFYQNLLFLVAVDSALAAARALEEATDRILKAFGRALSGDEYDGDVLVRTAAERYWDEELRRRIVADLHAQALRLQDAARAAFHLAQHSMLRGWILKARSVGERADAEARLASAALQ